MEIRYDVLIESVKKLPLHDKEDLRRLLDRYIMEERREEIYKNYLESLSEFKENKLHFSSDIEELKKQFK